MCQAGSDNERLGGERLSREFDIDSLQDAARSREKKLDIRESTAANESGKSRKQATLRNDVRKNVDSEDYSGSN